MKALTINAGRVQFKDVEDRLEVLRSEINCDLIDITSRKINGKYYDIVCDDEGFLKDAPIITAVTQDGRPQLVGGLVIVNYDGEGGLAGLDPEDVLRLSNAIQYTIQNEKLQPVVMLD